MRALRIHPLAVLAAFGAVAGYLACSIGVDPDKGRYSCDADPDCGPGFECRAQASEDRGRCFAIGECGDESCNGRDDDCDGETDEEFDLAQDDENCGACGQACPPGNTCRDGGCVEEDCANGTDDDGDRAVDCADGDCAGRSCSAIDATLNCGRALADAGEVDGGGEEPADAGVDAGADGGDEELDGGTDGGADASIDAGADSGTGADAGIAAPACVPRETTCGNRLDDDGDGNADCADEDCDAKPCVTGAACASRRCPGEG